MIGWSACAEKKIYPFPGVPRRTYADRSVPTRPMPHQPRKSRPICSRFRGGTGDPPVVTFHDLTMQRGNIRFNCQRSAVPFSQNSAIGSAFRRPLCNFKFQILNCSLAPSPPGGGPLPGVIKRYQALPAARRTACETPLSVREPSSSVALFFKFFILPF
jgi:hypothetical protein